jgi:hypothetical protein
MSKKAISSTIADRLKALFDANRTYCAMRHPLSLLGFSILLASPAFADPPEKGFVGTITYENGDEPRRFACDRLDLVRTLYETGQANLFLMRPKFDELVRTIGVYGEPQCRLGQYAQVKVLEPPMFLGPIKNPVGEAKLFYWAIHVDNSPKGGAADYWVLYLDTRGGYLSLQAGRGI